MGKKDDYVWIIWHQPTLQHTTVRRVARKSVQNIHLVRTFKTKEQAYRALLLMMQEHAENHAQHVENTRHLLAASRKQLSKLKLRCAVLETQLEIGTLPPSDDEEDLHA